MKKTLGFSPFGEPADGIGPFKKMFPTAVNLLKEKNLEAVDAVLLWGGADICPALYAEEPLYMRGSGPKEPTRRDLFELEICRQALKAGKPIIGVCRGAQFICAFAGGKLIQHATGHSSDHGIVTHDHAKFYVTSSHHQMLYPWDVNHELLAWSMDKRSNGYFGNEGKGDYEYKSEDIVCEPEVVFFPDVKGFAVQCHPEWHQEDDNFNKWMFEQMEECFQGVLV